MQPLVSEQILIQTLPELPTQRALVISQGRAQIGWHLAQRYPQAQVQAWYLDLHRSSAARQSAVDCGANIDVLCAADLPDQAFDLVAMPILKQGEAELTRELLQQAHQRLSPGGFLAVSVDNPRDSWLHQQMQILFDKVTVQSHERGRAYWARKSSPLKRIRDFSCQFQFRDGEHLIQAISRPGVFSHRRLDAGARQLINCAEIGPEDRVLDYGCGCGTVALAAAFKTSSTVYAVDANARAIECIEKNAQLNELNNIRAIWNADGQLNLPEPIDIALANPPYFGDQAIWKHFTDCSIAQLRPGGALLVVTKHPKWYAEYLRDRLDELTVAESGKYFIVYGVQPEP